MFTMDKDRKAQVLISEQKDRIAIISEKKESRTQSLKYLSISPFSNSDHAVGCLLSSSSFMDILQKGESENVIMNTSSMRHKKKLNK